jgi:hypothetical protein
MNGRTTPNLFVRSRKRLPWSVRHVWAWPVHVLRSGGGMARPQTLLKVCRSRTGRRSTEVGDELE